MSIFGYDGCCLKHGNSFCYYCKKCSKNLCIYCAKEHKEHEILNLFELDENCINYIDIIINNKPLNPDNILVIGAEGGAGGFKMAIHEESGFFKRESVHVF